MHAFLTILPVADAAGLADALTGRSALGRSGPPLPNEVIARLDAYDTVVHEALPAAPYWYLGVLATHPDCAGRRWGRAVMAAGLQHAAAGGLPAYLETTNPRNTGVYRNAGWEVVASATALDLEIWIMRHGPASLGEVGAGEPPLG